MSNRPRHDRRGRPGLGAGDGSRAICPATIGSDGGETTILRLFDTGVTPPRALTPFDTAYSKAFYQGQPTQLPFSRVGTMARSINRSLSQAVAAPGEESPRPAP